MINQVCFISENWACLFNQKLQVEGNLRIFIVRSAQEIANLSKMIYEKGFLDKNNFTICLDFFIADSIKSYFEESSQTNDYLYRILFHPNFLVNQNTPELFVTNRQKAFVIESSDIIQAYFLNQGYYKGELHYIDALETPEMEEIRFISDRYKNEFLAKFVYNKKLIVWSNNVSYEAIEQKLIETEYEYSRSEKLIFELLQRLVMLDRENHALRYSVEIQSTEVKNYKTYLDIYKELDEAGNIKKYYHYEYEVLPVWYKRIGHIVKVIMGKRSFRSLFDDSIKKYKE